MENQKLESLDRYLNDLSNLLETGHFPQESVKPYTHWHNELNLKEFVQKGTEFIRLYYMLVKSDLKPSQVDEFGYLILQEERPRETGATYADGRLFVRGMF